MKIGVNEVRVGNVIEYDGGLYLVVDREHIKPGKGPAYLQLKMRNVKTGSKANARLATSDTVVRARIDEMQCSVLYKDDASFSVMMTEDYEQREVAKDLVPHEKWPFIEDGMELTMEMHEGEPISVKFPKTIVVEIQECEAVIKGQTVSSSYKPATLSNGARLMVPQFIQSGEKVVMNSETLEYVERAK